MINKEIINSVLELHNRNVNASYTEIADELVKVFPFSHRTARRYASIIINSKNPTPE
jgi:hypothetical protein